MIVSVKRSGNRITDLVAPHEDPILFDDGEGFFAFIITAHRPRTDIRALGLTGRVFLDADGDGRNDRACMVERQIVDANRNGLLGDEGDIVRLRSRGCQMLVDEALEFTAAMNRLACELDAKAM